MMVLTFHAITFFHPSRMDVSRVKVSKTWFFGHLKWYSRIQQTWLIVWLFLLWRFCSSLAEPMPFHGHHHLANEFASAQLIVAHGAPARWKEASKYSPFDVTLSRDNESMIIMVLMMHCWYTGTCDWLGSWRYVGFLGLFCDLLAGCAWVHQQISAFSDNEAFYFVFPMKKRCVLRSRQSTQSGSSPCVVLTMYLKNVFSYSQVWSKRLWYLMCN